MRTCRRLLFILLLCQGLAAGASDLDVVISKMAMPPSVRPSQLLLYDLGYSSPFAVQVAYYPRRPECAQARGKRVLTVQVVDFGEDPDFATYCLSTTAIVERVKVEEVDDEVSHIGRASLVSIWVLDANGQRLIKVRVSPWGGAIVQ